MPSFRTSFSFILISAAAAAAPTAAFGCSVCGCSLSSDWAAQGYGTHPGLQGDLRFEYYNQDNLRSGLSSADVGRYPLPNDQEIQQDTLTRGTWLDLDWVGNPSWGIGLQLPYYDRFHSTIAPGDTEISESRASGLGDARVEARWQQYDPMSSFNVQFGLKLPTGRFQQAFLDGPEAGSPLDRGLQLGTGTTDALAGATYFRRLGQNWGGFGQLSLDQPLASRDGYLPSSSVNLNAGVRFLNTSSVTPQLQANARWDSREHGPEADTPNSGDTAVFLSPGLTIEAGAAGSIFAFVQLPVYQRVNGLQLEPRWLLSVGVRWRL
ncbi:MAG TPA: hypothetical protein VHC86_00575 [Opitutaceae bacterium]|nr:hypothetical protein [Opitutaceae bacterium]